MLFFFLSLFFYFFLFCFILSSSSSLFLICSFVCLDLFLLFNKLTELGKYLSVAQRICNFELIKWLKCSLEYGKTESMCSNRIKQNIGIYCLVYTDDIYKCLSYHFLIWKFEIVELKTSESVSLSKCGLFLLYSSQPPSVICKTIYLQFILQRCHYLYLHSFFSAFDW